MIALYLNSVCFLYNVATVSAVAKPLFLHSLMEVHTYVAIHVCVHADTDAKIPYIASSINFGQWCQTLANLAN